MPKENQEPIAATEEKYLGAFKTMALADILRDGVENASYSKCKVLSEWLEQNQNPFFAMQLLHFLHGYMAGTADRKRCGNESPQLRKLLDNSDCIMAMDNVTEQKRRG